ncbi:MAG: hypothetical protein WCP52_07900 [Bacteroidota bacterium]
MNIQSVKLDLVQKLLSVNNELVLKKINQILEKEVIVAFTIDGKPLTKEQYNKNLLAADKQIKAGNFIAHEELEKKSAKWKTKK